jgi:DNA mismatch repair protein MSH5
VSVEYVSQIGYLVAVQDCDLHLLSAYIRPRTRGDDLQDCEGYDDRQDAATAAETESFVFVYKQDGIHFYKHAIVCELDRSIGDIKSLISDRRKALMLGLEDLVLDAEQQLQQLSTVVSTIDALISLGTLAVEQSLVCPEIADDPVILIKGGRHLLQQLTVDAFIPNDTCISTDKNVALITGPNTSGKSVYLKQVALIVYLAHIGSFVPCEKARIGLTDAILTRINSVETVSAPQSAFALDLQQMSKMLRSHTTRSLCVIDEFGKGTTPVDGIALLAATVKHFALHKGSAIFVLHFTEIMDDQILSNELMRSISCFQMQTYNPHSRDRGGGARAGGRGSEYCEAEDPSDWDECAPLFKLHRGVAQSSQGIACAKSAGVDETILQRAAYIKSCVLSHSTIRPIINTQALDAIRDNARLITLFLSTNDWLQDSSQEGIDKLQELRTCYS